MANTYTLISSNTLSSSQASVTFSSIPSTYTDLILKISVRSTGGYIVNNLLYMNGVTSGSALSGVWIVAEPGSVASSRLNGAPYAPSGDVEGTDYTANTFVNGEIYIPSYTASQYKPISVVTVSENNASTAQMKLLANLYSSTNAISQLDIKPGDGFSYASGSSFWLYGIKSS